MPQNKHIKENLVQSGKVSLPGVLAFVLRGPADWVNLIFLFLSLGTAMWSVEQAHWIKPSPSFITILAIAVFLSFILSRSRLPSVAVHPVALIIGLAVLFWQCLLLLPEPSLASRVWHFANDIQAWWHAEMYGAPVPVTIHITLMFGYLSWVIGYFSAWFLFRHRNPWLAVFLGAIVILVNLNFGVSQKYFHFLIFLAVSLVFLALVNYTTKHSLLNNNPTVKWKLLSKSWVAACLCIIVVSVSVAWTNPGFRINAAADYAKTNSPFKGNSMELYWKNFFATVPGNGAPVLMHGGQQNMVFGGSLELNEQVVFFINSEHPNYWKTQIYDYYDSTGWKTSPTTEKAIAKEATGIGSPPLSNLFNITIIPQIKTNVLPITGEYNTANIPGIEKRLNPQLFEIKLSDSSSDRFLPQDIAAVARTIRAYRSSRRFNETQIASLLPSGLKLVSVNRSGTTIQSISISRGQLEESNIVALSSAEMMVPQQEAVISIQTVPNTPDDKLASAGVNYPKVVTDRYLQLPDSLPTRVRELASTITEGYDTPYLKAKGIKEYLSKIPYSLTIDTPPANADGVDFFLFTQKSGYCTYFASALTVMLRATGVPARMVSGFLPGQLDAQKQNYIIRDRDYHAWTEVYFPGYGWILFDPTPSNAAESASDVINAPTDVPPTDQNAIPDYTIDTSTPASNPQGYIGQIIGTIAGIIFLLLLLGWFRFYRNIASVPALYSRMVLLASLSGHGPKPWQTALEFSAQLSTALPEHALTINNVSRRYVISRYSQEPPGMPDDELNKSWPGLRHTLIKRFFHIK